VALVARGKQPSTMLASSSEARGAEERDLCLHEGGARTSLHHGGAGDKGWLGWCMWVAIAETVDDISRDKRAMLCGGPVGACLGDVVSFAPDAARVKAIWPVRRAHFTQRWAGMVGWPWAQLGTGLYCAVGQAW
jgi:hypothetical protein